VRNEFDELAHDLEAQLRAVRYLLAETETLTDDQLGSVAAASIAGREALDRVADLRKALLVARETLAARLSADEPTPRSLPEGLREAALPPPPGGLWTTEAYIIPVTAAWGLAAGRSGGEVTVDDLFGDGFAPAPDDPKPAENAPASDAPESVRPSVRRFGKFSAIDDQRLTTNDEADVNVRRRISPSTNINSQGTLDFSWQSPSITTMTRATTRCAARRSR
jgi:hypothetical protein